MAIKQPSIRQGNVYTKQNGARGWIMGDFKDNPIPYPFFSRQFSIKWAKLEKGDKKAAAQSDGEYQTVTILVRGRHRVDFPDTGESFDMAQEGDFVFFEPGVVHSWEAIEDNLTVTIRWSAEHPTEA